MQNSDKQSTPNPAVEATPEKPDAESQAELVELDAHADTDPAPAMMEGPN